jgi:hypothetical protein
MISRECYCLTIRIVPELSAEEIIARFAAGRAMLSYVITLQFQDIEAPFIIADGDILNGDAIVKAIIQ